MEFSLDLKYKLNDIDESIIKEIKILNDMFLEEAYKGNKVSYYYENMNNGYNLSFNPSICFYAASTLKVLVCLYLFKASLNNKIDLDTKVLITKDDLKQDSGVLKYQKEDKEYTILELIKYSIIESDNTAYVKLMNMVGKDVIREYGLSLGALHTMEGKETDSFGITNATDLLIYFKEIKEFIDENNKYSNIFKEYLLNPSFKIIEDDSIDSKFIRKYGEYSIAYHEAGYIEDEYYLIILTQLNEKEYKKEFINKVSKQILKIHNMINNQ